MSNPIFEEAKRLCKEFPNAPSRTLAKRLAASHKVTVEQARGRIRRVRGICGKANRRKTPDKSQYMKAKKSGWKPKMPPSKEAPWEPFILRKGRTLSLSDIHCPFHSEVALKAAVKYGKRKKPTNLLLNGDTLDFYAISRWQKDPSKRDFKAEIEANKELLYWLRDEFPNANMIFKAGNHEERWQVYLWNHAPEICDLPEVTLPNILDFEELEIEYIDNGRPIMAGALPIFHGHELPKGLTNPVNMARGAFLRMVDSVLVGHGHRSSSHTEPNWRHQEITTWSQGCLCGMHPEYARINKWNYGFAWIDHEEFTPETHEGEFNVHNCRISKKGKVRE